MSQGHECPGIQFRVMMIDLIWQQLMPHVIIGLQEASLIQEPMAALELRLVFKFVVFTEGLFNMCRSLTMIITDSSHTRCHTHTGMAQGCRSQADAVDVDAVDSVGAVDAMKGVSASATSC